MRVGGKVNDKDANHASYSNIVGCRKAILRRDFKPVRAQLFIPAGDLLASLVPNLEQVMLSHAGPARVLIRSGPSDDKFLNAQEWNLQSLTFERETLNETLGSHEIIAQINDDCRRSV